MKDEEFVKLRHWIDTQFTFIRIWIMITLGFVADNGIIWAGVIIYVIFAIFNAAVHYNYVESKHRGYLEVPRK